MKGDDKGPIRLGVMISGTGRNLQNLVDRIEDGRLDARIMIVVSSRADVAGVEVAGAAGLPCVVVRRGDYLLDEEFSAVIARYLRQVEVEIVVMAGFLVLWLVPDDFAGRVINIHPALLPKHGGKGMYGRRVHEEVLAAGDTVSGCTVHCVDNEYDNGPIILQREVPVRPDDTPDTLAARVFEEEKEALPEAIRRVAETLRGGG